MEVSDLAEPQGVEWTAMSDENGPVSLPVLKILCSEGTWSWIYDVRGIDDFGWMTKEEIASKFNSAISESVIAQRSRVLEITRLTSTEIHCLDAKKIYVCNGFTGSTIEKIV